MRANIKLILMVSVPLRSNKLEEALAEARDLKEKNILKFNSGVDYNDGSIEVVGVDSGAWVDHE